MNINWAKNYLLILIILNIHSIESLLLSNSSSSDTNKQRQHELYNRINGAYNIENPYNHLTVTQVCSELSDGMSGSANYHLWEIKYSNCVYLEGNLRLTNFQVSNPDYYDFSFLDNLTEITGYIYIHNTNIKNLRLKNLRLIRGQILFAKLHSVYISNNDYLETIDMPSLTEIQTGSIVIRNNKNLCINHVNWFDILPDKLLQSNSMIEINRPADKCFKCDKSCCQKFGNQTLCNCWTENSCQTLTKVICHSNCEDRCSKTGDCCHAQCAAGCTGPFRHNCSSCKNFRVKSNDQCIEQCPRRFIADPVTGQVIPNKHGMFQLIKTCVKECPSNWVVYQDLCLKLCPTNTYEIDIVDENNRTYVTCKECTPSSCPKTCSIEDSNYINKTDLKRFEGCEVLKGRFAIIEPDERNYDYLTEEDLEVFSSLREITHYVWIQSKKLKTLNFFRNLKIIKGRNLLRNTYALAINAANLKTLNLKNLKKVENGKILLHASNACLLDTIKWNTISNYNVSINNNSANCTSDGYICKSECDGCWSTEADMCQFCKTYKFNSRCVESCKTEKENGSYLYESDAENRVCDLCHPECDEGCTGPSEYECIKCKNVQIYHNSTTNMCLSQCPVTHYEDKLTKKCLPCYADCNGCYGPEHTISPNGCKHCSSAIVLNDASYTIQSCIRDRDCDSGYFPRIVPVDIENHPLQNKTVCRKCHPECKRCYGEGNGNCDRNDCVNLYSESLKACVEECKNDEYLDEDRRECSPCHSQCSNGCFGPYDYQCNQCKSFKIKSKDYMDLNLKLIQPLNDSYDYETILIDNLVHCVVECPDELPYFSSQKFCLKYKEQSYVFSIMIGIISFIFLFIILFIVWCYCVKRQEIRRRKQEEFINGHNNFDLNDSDPINLNIEPDLTKLKLIQREEFKKLDKLGSGAFGTVFKGIYMSSDGRFELNIAIKELQNDSGSYDKTDELLNEVHIMASVNHPYCLRLIGLCMVQPVSLITPLLPKGSVLTYFEKHKQEVTEKMLLIWCMQIAQGMSYLEKREIVHRDLAARNVLVQSTGHVKITDFGLSKIVKTNEEGFHADENMFVPLKWLAPECISKRLFTHKSDVWAFGVTAWELFTFGAKPYENVPFIELYKQIMQGLRLPQPTMTSLDIYLFLLKCWMEDPDRRPSFEQIASEFEIKSKEPKRFLSITANCYEDPLMKLDQNAHDLMVKYFNYDGAKDSNDNDFDSSDVRLLKAYDHTSSVEDDNIFLKTHEENSKSSSESSDDSGDKLTKLVRNQFFKQNSIKKMIPMDKIKLNNNSLYNRQDSAFYSASNEDPDSESLLNSRNSESSSSDKSSSDKNVFQTSIELKNNLNKDIIDISKHAHLSPKKEIMNLLKPSPIYHCEKILQPEIVKTPNNLQIFKRDNKGPFLNDIETDC